MSKHLQGQARSDGRQTSVGFMVQESLLPEPADLASFKEIDPSIVSWMMQYVDKEQELRVKAQEANIKAQEASIKLEQEELNSKIVARNAVINLDMERVTLTKSEQGIVKISLWLAFSIAVLFIALAGVLIFNGMEIAGTVFGGLALIMCVQAFLKFGRNQKQ
jgi:uncharacterized membrane protein